MVYFYNNFFTDQLSLDVNNLGMLRGYSAFEFIRTYQQTPFCLKAHLCRFIYTSKRLGLNLPYTYEELELITYKLIEKEGKDCGIKWYAFALNKGDGLRHDGSCDVFAMTVPLSIQPAAYFTNGIKTATFFEKRPLADCKTTAYLAACQLLSAQKDLQEVLYLDEKHHFLEASTSNLFFIKKGKIYTAEDQILYGITREVIIDISGSFFDVVEQKLAYRDLDSIDEAFITATNKEIMPISQIDEKRLPVGPITRFLMQEFTNFTCTFSNKDYVPKSYETALLLKS